MKHNQPSALTFAALVALVFVVLLIGANVYSRQVERRSARQRQEPGIGKPIHLPPPMYRHLVKKGTP